jgi:pimeloyl-ACP methyl ester carboxylesterase
MVTRTDVQFRSGEANCAAFWYEPADAGTSGPCIVMAHGLGGVKEVRLPAYAEKFAAAGFRVLVFDYRCFGSSGGQPRQLLGISRQLADWEAAIHYAKGKRGVDAKRIGLWGTSFSGGHVLVLAARHPELAAAVVQCPYTDGISDGVKKRSWWRTAQFIGTGLLDVARGIVGMPPIYLPIHGKPGDFAILTSPNAERGFRELSASLPPETTWRQYIAARFVLGVPFYRPVRHASKIRIPLLVCVCDGDQDVDPRGAHDVARMAGGKSIGYPIEHFEIYLGQNFEKAVADQAAFFSENLADRADPSRLPRESLRLE